MIQGAAGGSENKVCLQEIEPKLIKLNESLINFDSSSDEIHSNIKEQVEDLM